MAKKKREPRASRKNLARNAEWLEEKLAGMSLDLDAISSMPIEEVREELGDIVPDTRAFIEALNERLPKNAGILTGASKPRKNSTRAERSATNLKKKDRKAIPSAGSPARRGPFRLLSLRNALIVSVLIILLAVFLPQFIRSMRETELQTATAVDPIAPETTPESPTWFEGPAANEMLRGIRYRVEGLEQIAIDTPLPENPGDLSATFRMQITIDGQGNVTGLEPLTPSAHALEPAVIDSLLRWRFNAIGDNRDRYDGTITVEYFDE